MSWPEDFPAEPLHRVVDVHAMLQLERGGRAQIEAWQAHQWWLVRDWLMAHAPWWRERLAAMDGAPPARGPIVTRAEMQEMVARHGAVPTPPDHGPVQAHATSGSSGKPLRYFVTPYTQRLVAHGYFSDHARQGRDPYTLRAVIDERSPQAEGGTHTLQPGSVEAGTGPVLLRNVAQFSAGEHLAWLVQHAPAHLSCLPWWLDELFAAAEAGGPRPRLQQLLTYSGDVTPRMRERARDLFGARIVDRYSTKECGPLAFQCPASDAHYHVAVAHVRLEVVADDGTPCAEAMTGRVLVTGLHHLATPIVRYDIGDVAAVHPRCPGCGADIPALSHLLGRRLSLLRTRDGQLVSGIVAGHHWLDCAPVREHRLVQSQPGEVEAEVVLAHAMTAQEEAALVAMLQDVLGPGIHCRVRQVESIPRPPGEKPQTVLSLIG